MRLSLILVMLLFVAFIEAGKNKKQSSSGKKKNKENNLPSSSVRNQKTDQGSYKKAIQPFESKNKENKKTIAKIKGRSVGLAQGKILKIIMANVENDKSHKLESPNSIGHVGRNQLMRDFKETNVQYDGNSRTETIAQIGKAKGKKKGDKIEGHSRIDWGGDRKSNTVSNTQIQSNGQGSKSYSKVIVPKATEKHNPELIKNAHLHSIINQRVIYSKIVSDKDTDSDSFNEDPKSQLSSPKRSEN